MKTIVAGFIVGFALSWGVLYAQSPQVAVDQAVAWDQPGPTLAAVQSYRYTARIDGGAATVVTPTCQANPAPTPGFSCALPNPGPTPGPHTMSLTYAIPLSGGGFTGESPAGNCAWDTVGNPTQPPSNFRWGRIVAGIFALLVVLAAAFT